jgi:putative DNA methylase
MEVDESEPERPPLAAPFEATLLERGFPFREVSLVINADRRAHDPIYGAHRWWARRPPALLRSMLLAAALPADHGPESFWGNYQSTERQLRRWRVHDPFVGGGSTLVEAARLGASVSGGDVDPLAVDIVRYELRPAAADKIRAAGKQLLEHLRAECGPLYPSTSRRQPLHYFWLHQVTCPACHQPGLLYRDLVVARDRQKPGAVVRDHPLTVFCPEDLSVHQLNGAERRELRYRGRRWRIDEGTYIRNRYVCPSCGERSAHKDLLTGLAPRRLIAVEETEKGKRRRIRKPSRDDLAAARTASEWLTDHRGNLLLPTVELATERHDERPISFGMKHAVDLFTDRQLAVFGSAFAWLASAKLDPDVRDGLRLAVSNALATNNKLCGYAYDYGRLSALFSVRGYSLPALPVELNPLHADGGRGTLHHCIERVSRAGTDNARRHVWSATAAAVEARSLALPTNAAVNDVKCMSATTSPSASDPSADLCVFDPPYFDYIAYSELSEFYRAWLAPDASLGTPLLPGGSDPGESFGLELGVAMRSALARLAPGRPLAFTYHSASAEAWRAVGIALDEAKLRVTALWPVYSDGHMGHHSHPGNCEWDLVLVCRRVSETNASAMTFSAETWAESAKPLSIGDADRASMAHAISVASCRFGTPAKES